MNNELYISFIVTAYNLPASLLEACLKSIFALSLSENEYEVIVVDDGSDEPEINAISAFSSRIVYVRQPHGGLSAARNRGIDYARGRFIQFVDGDDCLLQAPYEHCLDIVRFHHPVDVVMFHYTHNKPRRWPSAPVFGPVTGASYMKEHNLRGSACGYLFRKAILGNLRFTKDILHEDEEFTPLLLLNAQFVYDTPAEAYYYRLRKASITHTVDDGYVSRRMDDLYHTILHLHAVAAGESAERQEALGRRVAQLSMDYLFNVVRLTRDGSRLNESIELLRNNGLYPLPDKPYGLKYQLFRKLLLHKSGRKLLFLLSPAVS